MKIKTILFAASLCLAISSTVSLADNGYSSTLSPNNSGGYSSTQSSRGSTYYSGYPNESAPTVRFKRKNFSIGITDSGVQASYQRRFYEEAGPHWIDMLEGYPLPANAVLGGGENNPSRGLYVCRASYQGGMFPGKLVAGDCNISWGGDEIRLPRYQVLVSHMNKYGWLPANYGAIPPNAIPGGFENGRTLYICQANWQGGVHPGKVLGGGCDFGYGGIRISVPFYNVLVFA